VRGLIRLALSRSHACKVARQKNVLKTLARWVVLAGATTQAAR